MRALLFLALATAVSAQTKAERLHAEAENAWAVSGGDSQFDDKRHAFIVGYMAGRIAGDKRKASSLAGAQQFGEASTTILRPSVARVPADRPGWWQRHLGDSALHLGATSLDAASSWGRVELNPLLRSADGRFGARGLGVKLAIFGGVELAKWSLLQRGERGRWVRSLSLGPAVAFGGVAARNWRAR